MLRSAFPSTFQSEMLASQRDTLESRFEERRFSTNIPYICYVKFIFISSCIEFSQTQHTIGALRFITQN